MPLAPPLFAVGAPPRRTRRLPPHERLPLPLGTRPVERLAGRRLARVRGATRVPRPSRAEEGEVDEAGDGLEAGWGGGWG